MPKDLPKILPCPWKGCKAKPKLHFGQLGYVSCSGYGCRIHAVYGPTRKTERGAIEAWNKGVKR